MEINCNGVYWHSELYRPRDHHYKKKRFIESKGFKFIQIWEDDWFQKKEIVKLRILNLLGLSRKSGARQYTCQARKFSKEIKEFLEMNHLQGFFAASVFYTLEKDGEIFALVSFRKMKNNKFELSRFCVKMGESISGALKRLYYSEKRRTVSSSSFIYLN